FRRPRRTVSHEGASALLSEHGRVRKDHSRRNGRRRDRDPRHAQCHRGGAGPMSGVIDVSRRAPERLTLLQKLYIPELLPGMAVTVRHLARNLTHLKNLPTILYPEQKRDYSGRFRGKHILKTRQDGTLKCVACYMCEQACPAECI